MLRFLKGVLFKFIMEKLGKKFREEVCKMEHNKPSLKNKKEVLIEVERLLIKALKKRKSDVIAFSGGIDSALLAALADWKVKLVCVGLEGSPDLIEAEKLANENSWDIIFFKITSKDVENAISKVVKLVEGDYTNISIAAFEFLLYGFVKKLGYKSVITGLGAEEIFAGYKRHRDAKDVHQECWNGLKELYEKDLVREEILAKYFKLDVRSPFLDKDLVEYAMKIDPSLKVTSKGDKFILRELGSNLGLSVAFRAKKAMQYGSGFDKAVEKLAPKSKGEYVNSFINLGVLYSSGKDSNLALLKMKEKGFSIKCLMVMESLNQDSYMFHTPAIELTKLQAKSLKLPMVVDKTKGVKEDELKDLKRLIKKAKDKYKLDGIVTGALYSSYQADRIAKICSSLGLRCYNPLWHMDQEEELREVISKFDIILTGIAADGLDKSWLGRRITSKDVDKLVELNKKNGLNIAFEGGEAESLVVDGKGFSKKLVLDFDVKEESKIVARLVVKKAKLI